LPTIVSLNGDDGSCPEADIRSVRRGKRGQERRPAVGDLKALGRGSMLMRRALSLSILFLPRFSRYPRLLPYDVQP
jgi:hypothetical protein